VITVLVVDDQDLIREGFRALIDSEPDLSVVGVASDGQQAIAQSQALRPDVVLMDIRMPHLDGIEATLRIRREPALLGTRILILTTFSQDDYVLAALRAGASGFLLKDAPVEELRNGIRMVATGAALLAPQATRALIQAFIQTPEPSLITTAAGLLRGLTARELEITGLVAEGLSNGEIAERLVLSQATVKTHISRILGKLDLRDRVQLVIAAYEARLIGRQP